MIEKVAKASEKRPYTVIALCGLITLFMFYGATQITMSSELEKFLPEKYASVRVTNELENVTGGSTSEIILIEGDNVTKASVVSAIAEFEDALRRNQEFQTYIKYVRSFPDYIENLGSLSNAELEKRVQSLLSQYEEMSDFVSENQNSALINIQVNSQLTESDLKRGTKALHLCTQGFDENHATLEAKNTGMLSMRLDTEAMMNRDNRILIPVAIVTIIVILFLVFRRLSDTGLPFLVLGLGSVWMIGTMGFVGIPFTMVFVALVPIILGIGIDYTIHILNRYYEESERGLTAKKSAVRSVSTVGVAISLTAITTIIGFGSFGISDLPPIQNFGFLAGSGVFFIFVLTTTLLPSLLVLRDREGEKKKREGG